MNVDPTLSPLPLSFAITGRRLLKEAANTKEILIYTNTMMSILDSMYTTHISITLADLKYQ